MQARSISDIMRELESLVSIELYATRAIRGESLLVSALREGQLNIYLYSDGTLTRVNRGIVSNYTVKTYNPSRVVIARDVAKGRELHKLYIVDLDEPGVEKPVEDMEPLRVLGLVDTGDMIVFSGATMQGNGLYITDGSETRKVKDLPGFAMVTDSDGRHAVGVGALDPLQPSMFQLFLVDLETGDMKVHKPREGSVFHARITSRGIVYVNARSEDSKLMLLDPGSMEARELELPYSDLSEYKPVMITYLDEAPDGRLVVVAGRDGRSRVFVDGKSIPGPEGLYASALLDGDRVIATYTSLRTPTRVIEISSGETRVVLAGRTPDWLEQALSGIDYVYVDSFDGERVPTFILYSGRTGRPGPTVVLVHGGPFAADMDAWSVMAASLAILGFHVVMPNYRGSVGYGERWRNKIIGDVCGGELEDVVSAARWASDNGVANRLYIMGYSYGGFMTMCALTRKPGVFKAGVAGASVVDWVEMYELSDAAFRSFIDMLFPGMKEERKTRSPISYVDNLQEPLCIIHPQNDSRTPLKPVLRFMMEALEKGKRYEAHIIPDMGHAVNTVDDIVKILLPAILFLKRLEESQEG
ncbi:MAG: S9 family peptidase [Desulfurococcales archaeon]|nr:S9 family peptidase [Desulfurococcales archaeon]